MVIRICRKCNVEKPITDFEVRKDNNYPLSYAPFNSNQFLPINREHVFTCFADQDAVCKAKLRQKINSSYVKFKLKDNNKYFCNYCGAEGNDDNPLHLDHIDPTFNEIYEEYKMRYGKLTLLAGNYGVFSDFHDKRANFQLWAHENRTKSGKIGVNI